MTSESELLSRLSKNLSDSLKAARPGMAVMHTHSSPTQNVYTMTDGTGGSVCIVGNEVKVVVERLRDNAATQGMEMNDGLWPLGSDGSLITEEMIGLVVDGFYAQPPKI